MTGSEFAKLYAPRGLYAWEAAALDLARQGQLTPWPWIPITLSTSDGHTATIQVRSDVLAVGPVEDHLRLPLTPRTAQSIANLDGSLLPTPWIVYQTWRQAPVKVRPIGMGEDLGEQNQGPVMRQYVRHDAAVDAAVAEATSLPWLLTSGQKKDVVVSNIAQPGKVLIFGWYYPDRGDVFDDRKPWMDPSRQPRQAHSNAHGAEYVDYSHGIRLVHPIAVVDGRPMRTVDLYQHPDLSRLVSHEGPLRTPRYPAAVPPVDVRLPNEPVAAAEEDRPFRPLDLLTVSTVPSSADRGLQIASALIRKGRT